MMEGREDTEETLVAVQQAATTTSRAAAAPSARTGRYQQQQQTQQQHQTQQHQQQREANRAAATAPLLAGARSPTGSSHGSTERDGAGEALLMTSEFEIADDGQVVGSHGTAIGGGGVGAGDDEDYDEDERNVPMCCGLRRFVVLCIGLTGLTSVLLGYDIGIMSGAKLQIQRYLDLSDRKVELMVGILNFISAFGGLVSGRLSDYIGRKLTVALACVLFIMGSVLMAFARTYNVLMSGRVITGVGVGTGLAIAPLYMAELSPKKARGALVSFNEVAINIGILLGFLGGFAFSHLSERIGWRWMLGLGAVPPLIILASLVFLPESPRWLIKHRTQAAALAVLRKTCGPVEAQSTLAHLLADAALGDRGSWYDLFSGGASTRKLLLAGIGVSFFQQASGIEALVYYVPEVLKDSGITDEQEQLLANAGIGVIKVLFIFVAMHFSDKLGRRKLLLMSAFGMAAAFVVAALSFELGNIFQLTITGISLYMAAFSIGFGPMAWVVASEVVPLQVRGIAMGIATFINRILSGTIAMSYLSLKNALSSAGTFYLFGAVALLSALFVYLFVPETKGRALEDIEHALADLPCRHDCLGFRRGGQTAASTTKYSAFTNMEPPVTMANSSSEDDDDDDGGGGGGGGGAQRGGGRYSSSGGSSGARTKGTAETAFDMGKSEA
ncbi:hypothetical protein PTSG_06549 [Salpingoeca rosetta]|uniref:Major facilitator superfamily (MFS) profile domain-containing protein n=1 Tax=Salpingoeca rosetta (strain ATCC 50818 / BSB-021) TaxID=946362 RepID=F2UG47_SALR5|nr:uncharacterized protein PTSG_06549 [Salpingoeca rosetta]EGD75475.1 hypothetical protein PTSG_06549 [Salpingoeca rosetta]|eukprot:XP_004991932.1 hypothetical protein PTSG_06549 [Salpingoeca rosetta]